VAPRIADSAPPAPATTPEIERFAAELCDSGFRVRGTAPLPGWRETVAYRPADGTLYVPDLVGTAPLYTVGDERLGVYLFRRPTPPRDLFSGLAPERILVGHGAGVFDDAGLDDPTSALSRALERAQAGFPRELVEDGPTQLRAFAGAVWE